MDTGYEKLKPLILAVDDDQVTLHMMEKTLEGTAEIIKKRSGVDALEYLSHSSVDLVLLDYKMPDMNGIEVLKCMKHREETKNVPVIVLTADANMELETEVFRSGAVDFIRKPFVAMALQERVWRVVQNEYFKKNMRREATRQVRRVEEQLAASEELFEQTAQTLARTIDAKGEYTQGHSRRVAEYARQIFKAAGESPKNQRKIYCMGLLHDIGKIGVPSAILNKPSGLTEEEYRKVKEHTTIGADILKSIGRFPELAIGARSHHERWDGKGYPDGIGREAIPLEARAIAVADAYDAMTSPRSYRDVMPQERVRREIERGRGTQFDPRFANIMLGLIDADVDYQLRSHDEEEAPLAFHEEDKE
ncbi:MAG: HD domain-containing protein [Selenomonadaceae bacterium]|nr:HD domain-containing protein [Selenomonadaceae bacterium]